MALENERKFLVKMPPDLTNLQRKEIEQHYITEGPDPLRLRGTDGTMFELTKKLTLDPADLSRKDEINIPLREAQFRRLRSLSLGALTKTRYLHPLPDGLTAEIDVYRGSLQGLMTVEVEFPNETLRSAFVPPRWFGKDVSQARWAKNAELAGKSLADIKHHLDQ